MSDDRSRTVAEAIEAALIETHHLANISGLNEAKLARRRLVEAQTASKATRAHDRLDRAVEYLELARLERRDCAAGFVEARELIETAIAGLGTTGRGPVRRSPAELLAERETRKSLQELRREVASGSFEQLRHEVLLDETFGHLRREAATDGDGGSPEPEPDPSDLDVERALALASREMEIAESVQNARSADSEFEFVSRDSLTDPEEG